MKQSLGITLCAAAFAASASGLAMAQTMMASPAPGGATTIAPYSDAEFARVIQQANDGEIATARYVLRSSKNPAVRAFATQMVGDHSTSDVALQTAARNAHVPAPERVMAGPVDPALRGTMEPQLDVAYLRQQVEAHSNVLMVLTQESSVGKAPELRAFATNQAPIVKAHLDKAQNILSGMPNKPGSMATVEPLAPGGVGGQNGPLMPPSTPMPSGSNSPNPQPSVGIPGTLPSPGPSSTPHS